MTMLWAEMTAGEKYEAVASLPGVSASEIARKYGCHRETIRSVQRRVGEGRPTIAQIYGARDKRDQTIMELLAKGLNKREVAREMGLTPGAVSGAVSRMRARKLLAAPPPKDPNKPKAKKHSVRGGMVSQKRISQLSRVDNTPLRLRESLFDPLPGTTPVPYGSRGCKWAVDGLHGKGLLWCGQERETSRRDNEPFCAAHARIAYQAIKPRSERKPVPAVTFHMRGMR